MTQIYAWPLLATLFSEVLTSAEWLRLFDNVFSNQPAFLVMCVVAYNSVNRGPLMKCTEEDDFKVRCTVAPSVSGKITSELPDSAARLPKQLHVFKCRESIFNYLFDLFSLFDIHLLVHVLVSNFIAYSISTITETPSTSVT